ncbi:tetratricopeptide repeat protein [bacterium]|nr:tetratricopeptide repeat protein [bacterium]
MRFKTLCAIPIILAVLAIVTIADVSADYDTAFELYKAKKYSEAIPMLEEWCNKYTKDPRGGYTLSQCYLKTKQNEKALKRLAIVLGHHPEHAPSQFLTGILKLKSSPENSLPHFQEAVKTNSENGKYQYYYGSALMATKQYEKAAKAMKKAVELNPKNGKAQLDLGKILLISGKPAEAVSHLKIASEGKRDKALALYYLGLAQYKLKDFPDAVSTFEQAGQIKPTDAKIFYNLGLAREGSLGENPTTVEACQPMIDAFNKAVQLESGNADYQFRLGNAYETAGRSIYTKTAGNKTVSSKALEILDKATKAYNAAIASDASNPAVDRLTGISQMIENIKNPQVIEEEVVE